MQPAPSCEEREVLRSRFRADLKVYIDAAFLLDSCTPHDFDVTYEHAERARLAFERARRAFNAHLAAHKCGF